MGRQPSKDRWGRCTTGGRSVAVATAELSIKWSLKIVTLAVVWFWVNRGSRDLRIRRAHSIGRTQPRKGVSPGLSRRSQGKKVTRLGHKGPLFLFARTVFFFVERFAVFFTVARFTAFFVATAFFLGERLAAVFLTAFFFTVVFLAATFFFGDRLAATFFFGERFAVFLVVVFFAAFFLTAI